MQPKCSERFDRIEGEGCVFDSLLLKCNEWINRVDRILGLSPLPNCNEWMKKFF